MPRYRLTIEERIIRQQYVEADNAKEARQKYKVGAYKDINTDAVLHGRIRAAEKVHKYFVCMDDERSSYCSNVWAVDPQEAITLKKAWHPEYADRKVSASWHDENGQFITVQEEAGDDK